LKSTGVIRKIDELGRVVLPKEIRRNLKIRDGENLEILVENDYIILKKYSKVADNTEIIKKIGDLVAITYPFKVIITDRDKVIFTNHYDVKIGDNLDGNLFKLIQDRETLTSSELISFKFGENMIDGYFLIMPIISSTDAIGLIIFYDKETKIPDYYLHLAKLVVNIVVFQIDIA
jgi:AbrB family transcriptional regulator (stage V sporulation protein T)